jgi:hypothetical protein
MPDRPRKRVFVFYHRVARVRDDAGDASPRQAELISDIAGSYGLRDLDPCEYPGESAFTGPAETGE